MSVLHYSSPQNSIGELRRESNLLVAPFVAALPDRCIKCGQPCGGYRVKKRFFRKPPFFARIFPIDLLFILFSLLRSRITLAIGLCPRHRRRRKLVLMIASPIAIAGFAVLAVAANDYLTTLNSANAAITIPIGLLVGGGAAVLAVMSFQIVSLKKCDHEHAWYSGASPAFLRDIPAVQ